MIATAAALPLVAIGIVAIVLGGGGSGTGSPGSPGSPAPSAPLPAVTAAAPPEADRFAAQCAKVLAHLPVRLGALDPRVVHTTPDTPFVVAWGDPPVILRCGVGRPAALHPGSTAQLFSATGRAGPFFVVTSSGGDRVWTTVDRAAYVSISVPTKYAAAPVPALARAIAEALPPVCTTRYGAPRKSHCTRRP